MWKVRLRAWFNRFWLNPLTCWLIDALLANKSLGGRGETAAERYLLKQGLLIVGKGFSDLGGEIDLIAVEDRTIVFVEVKTRTSDQAGHPAEAVDLEKQTKISRVATSYLKHHDLLDYPVRFDVIAIQWPESNQSPQIIHYRDAFESAI